VLDFVLDLTWRWGVLTGVGETGQKCVATNKYGAKVAIARDGLGRRKMAKIGILSPARLPIPPRAQPDVFCCFATLCTAYQILTFHLSNPGV
jgi:hypothetical protein